MVFFSITLHPAYSEVVFNKAHVRTKVPAPHPVHVALAVRAGAVVVAHGARARAHHGRRLQPAHGN